MLFAFYRANPQNRASGAFSFFTVPPPQKRASGAFSVFTVPIRRNGRRVLFRFCRLPFARAGQLPGCRTNQTKINQYFRPRPERRRRADSPDKTQSALFAAKWQSRGLAVCRPKHRHGSAFAVRSDSDRKPPPRAVRPVGTPEPTKKNRSLSAAVFPSDRSSPGQRKGDMKKTISNASLASVYFYQCLFLAATITPASVRTAITATIAVASPVCGGF